MNATIETERCDESELAEGLGHSWQWFVDSAKMVDRGWRFFCRKRGWDPVKAARGVTPAEEMKMEVMAKLGRTPA